MDLTNIETKVLYNELCNRRKEEPRKKIKSPDDCLSFFMDYSLLPVEYFCVLTLDGGNNPIKLHEITKGTINRTLVHPREVFYAGVSDLASGIICMHNHPSGSVEPSREDIELTERLKKASNIMGIQLLDHVIVSKTGYFSFLEQGIL